MKPLIKYLLVMLLPLGVLLVRPLTPALVLALGQEIRLETEPFDPRDIFRGDYVELRFAIEKLPLALTGTESRDIGRDEEDETPASYLYVTLQPDANGIYRPVRLTEEPPSGNVYIRGRIIPYYWDRDREYVYLDYGENLRRFYVKENTGLALEDAARHGEVVAVAKVWKGRIVLESVQPK